MRNIFNLENFFTLVL